MLRMKQKLIIGLTISLLLFLAIGLNGMDFKVNEFRKLLSDFQAEKDPVFDLDRNYCTVLRVETDVQNDLELSQKVYKKIVVKPGVYYFYISSRENQITFKAPNYNSHTVNVPKNGLSMGTVYYIRLESIEEKVVPKKTVEVLKTEPKVEIKEEPKQIPQETKQTQIKQGIEFQLEQCFYAGDAITVVLNVTNQKEDMEITLYDRYEKNYIRIIDEKGMEYRSPIFKFGTHSGDKYGNGIKKVTIVENVKTKLVYNFKEINTKPKIVERMDILLFIPELNSCFVLQFRDVKINY